MQHKDFAVAAGFIISGAKADMSKDTFSGEPGMGAISGRREQEVQKWGTNVDYCFQAISHEKKEKEAK